MARVVLISLMVFCVAAVVTWWLSPRRTVDAGSGRRPESRRILTTSIAVGLLAAVAAGLMAKYFPKTKR